MPKGAIHAGVTVVAAPSGRIKSRVWRRSRMRQVTESRRLVPLSYLSSDREHALAALKLCASA